MVAANLSTADALAHYYGPFFQLYIDENPDMSMEEIKKSNRQKLAKDKLKLRAGPMKDGLDSIRFQYKGRKVRVVGNDHIKELIEKKNPMAPGYQSYSWTTEDWRSIKVNNKGEIDYKEKCGAEGTQTPDGSPRLCLPVEVIRSLLRTESGKDVIRTQARKKARAKKGERVPWHPRIKKIWKRVKEQSPKDKKNPPKILTPVYIRKHPNTLFVFGDNDMRTGKGGQAVNRDEPNAIGIRTKHKPTTNADAYYTDDNYTENIRKMQEDLDNIKRLSADYESVYFMQGIGEGRAKLEEKAPKTYAWLKNNLSKNNFSKKNPNHIKISHYPDPDPEAGEGMMRIDLHEGGDNVGFLQWKELDDVVHINYLKVKKSHRRNGLGKLLLDEFGKMHKGKKIQLSAPLGQSRDWIPEWYQRYGFKLVESDSNLMALQNPGGWRHGKQMEDDPFAEYFEENVEGDENTTTV